MDEVEQILKDAWERVRAQLADDPNEVRRRLERGRRMWARRPPRAWCLAVRASDARINPIRALCEPEDAAYPNEQSDYATHTVTLDVELLRRLCPPVRVEGYGEEVRDVGKKLGRGEDNLTAARALGVFSHRHVPRTMYRGKPVPILSSRELLDPGQRLLAPADRVWDWTGPLWEWRVPDDLPPQAVQRVPIYYDRTKAYRDKDDLHPEHPDREGASSRYRNPRRPLPPPAPDNAWYKWRGDEFVGYDWRRAETNPLVRENYERHERQKEARREAAKRRRREGRLTPSEQAAVRGFQGSLAFRGWRWLCPICERRIKVIFYPLPPINVLRGYGCLIPDPLIDDAEKLCAPIDTLRKAHGFACDLCHGVRPFSRVDRNGWNEVVCYLSGGLLYGSEAARPSWLTPDRKRAYRPIPSRAPSERRAQVQERLLNGWSYRRIAEDLKVAEGTVMGYASRVYALHGVHSRYELAQKLGVTLPVAPRQIQST